MNKLKMGDITPINLDKLRESLFSKKPWYIELYYFFRYRLRNTLIDKRIEFFGFFQRGKKGYARYDLWTFDHYLCKVIGAGIKELAEGSCGWPDKEFKTFEEYTEMLNKMADGFLNYYDKSFENDGPNEEDARRLEESLELFKKYFVTLWD